jgi:hypothetical protein
MAAITDIHRRVMELEDSNKRSETAYSKRAAEVPQGTVRGVPSWRDIQQQVLKEEAKDEQ